MSTKEEIIDEYEDKKELYSDYTDKLKDLLYELLEETEIKVHIIDSRIKEKSSLEDKLNKPDANYRNLEDVTDICGLCIITYYVDDVEKVAKLIEDEFEIDGDILESCV